MRRYYKCYDCGEEFDEPATRRELVGEFWGTPAYDNFDCCPRCRSDEIEEVFEDDETDYND